MSIIPPYLGSRSSDRGSEWIVPWMVSFWGKPDLIPLGKSSKCVGQSIQSLSSLHTVGCFNLYLVGGFNHPLGKMMEWKSVGMMKFPIYGKIKHVPNHQPAIFDDFPLLVGYIPNWCSLVYLSWLHLHFPCFSELPHFLRLPRGGLNLGVLDISDWVGYPYCWSHCYLFWHKNPHFCCLNHHFCRLSQATRNFCCLTHHFLCDIFLVKKSDFGRSTRETGLGRPSRRTFAFALAWRPLVNNND